MLAQKIDNAEKLVAYCLKNFPETRGDDKELILKVWELQGFRLPKNLIPFFRKVLNPETITRCRRKIQGEGLFLPDSLRVAERSLFAIEARNYWRGKNEADKK